MQWRPFDRAQESARGGEICFSVKFAVALFCSLNLGWGAPEVKARGAAN
jgi:hypothetical protein